MESGIDISKLLMLFIPIVLLELGIRIFALVHMLKNENLRGNRIMWLFLILLVSFFGWIAYFIFGTDRSNADA